MKKEKLNLEQEYEKLQIEEVNVNNENSLIEKKIDDAIYKLYGLTKEEIRIVEKSIV